jgi:hypothetical protein
MHLRLRQALAGAVGPVCTFAIACGSILGIDEPEREGSRSGGGGTQGGAAGAGAEQGGRAQGGATRGGSPATGGGGADGGDAGESGSGANSGAGGAGAGGDDTGPQEPALGAPCDEEEAHACAAASDRLALLCDEKRWTNFDVCRTDELCDRSDGACRSIASICISHGGSACTGGDRLLDCDVSPFDPKEHLCPFGCRDAACLPGTGDQLIVHTQSPTSWGTGAWPGPIPVCFVDGEESDELRHIVRDEVESTWARWYNVDFAGWGTCEDGVTERVAIEFLDDCRAKLASDAWIGKPSTGAETRFGICRTYLDANDMSQTLEEPVMRFLARHQFGHVLGLWDVAPSARTTMSRGIELSRIDEYQPSTSELMDVHYRYGRKHSGAVATTHGRCLDVVNGAIQPLPCKNPTEQRWAPMLGELTSLSSSSESVCVRLVGQKGIEVRPCDSEPRVPAWSMTHAQWRGPGGCVSPLTQPAVSGSSLVTGPCLAVGEPSQAWFFEIFDSDANSLLTRIRPSDSNLCLTVPNGFESLGVVPLLEVCGPDGTTEQIFHLQGNGTIRFSDFCLNWEDTNGDIYLLDLCTWPHWVLSGAFESSTGLALRTPLDDSGSALMATPLVGLPTNEQIFDFYF